MTGFTVLDYSMLVRKALVLLSELEESDFDGEAQDQGDCGDSAGAERATIGAHDRSPQTETAKGKG